MSSDTYGDPTTRERILQGAWELLEEKQSSVPLADVAKRAGVSRQAVYLHFGDRTTLLIAVVDFIDRSLGAEERIAHILSAPSGVEALSRLIAELSSFTEQIDSVARVIETGRDHDPGLAAAWEDRMQGRKQITRMITTRLEEEGSLAPDWTVDTASELLYALSSPATWHLVVRNLGWTPDKYTSVLSRVIIETLTTSKPKRGIST